jgi:hypothetical protein
VETALPKKIMLTFFLVHDPAKWDRFAEQDHATRKPADQDRFDPEWILFRLAAITAKFQSKVGLAARLGFGYSSGAA